MRWVGILAFVGCVACLGGAQPAPGLPAQSPLQRACTAQPGERPDLAGVAVEEELATPGDLPAIRVTSKATGAFMRVHYDTGSERIARARAACLGAQLPIVERETGDDRRGAEWMAAVFTQDRTYIPPRGGDVQPRWVIDVEQDGTLTKLGHVMVVHTIPHEQVHSWQMRGSSVLPRWVLEGHARWVQDKIVPIFDPAVAISQDRVRTEQVVKADGPLNLAQWGSERPKREAYLRQVSPEDRARMEADPNYYPTGTFTFTTDDFESDASNFVARYAAATAIFTGLERRHGANAVRDWMTEVTSLDGRVSKEALATSIRRHFGEELDNLLAERPTIDPDTTG